MYAFTLLSSVTSKRNFPSISKDKGKSSKSAYFFAFVFFFFSFSSLIRECSFFSLAFSAASFRSFSTFSAASGDNKGGGGRRKRERGEVDGRRGEVDGKRREVDGRREESTKKGGVGVEIQQGTKIQSTSHCIHPEVAALRHHQPDSPHHQCKRAEEAGRYAGCVHMRK